MFVACADDDADTAATFDASSDGPLLGDTSPVDVDATVSAGDVCGDRSGTQANAPWPLRGGCPKRPGHSSRSGPQTGALAWTVDVPTTESSPAVAADGTTWFGAASGELVAVTASGVVLGRTASSDAGAVRSSPAIDTTGAAVFVGTDGVLYGVRAPSIVDLDAGADGGDGGDGGDGTADGGGPAASVAFSRPVGQGGASPVLAPDGTILVGTSDGKLHALAGAAASERWSASIGDGAGASPALGGDTVYVGTSSGALQAFALADGAARWSVALGSPLGSPAVGGDGTIYVGTEDGRLVAVDPSGKERWTFAAGGAIRGTPAVYAGTVYAGGADKKLHAVATATGKETWAYTTLGSVGSPVIAGDGVVYVGASDARVYAIYPSGTLFFAVNVKGAVASAPAITSSGALLVTTSTGLASVGP